MIFRESMHSPNAGLTDTKQRASLLPDNFGAIQTVKGRYKKERRRRLVQIDGKRVEWRVLVLVDDQVPCGWVLDSE